MLHGVCFYSNFKDDLYATKMWTKLGQSKFRIPVEWTGKRSPLSSEMIFKGDRVSSKISVFLWHSAAQFCHFVNIVGREMELVEFNESLKFSGGYGKKSNGTMIFRDYGAGEKAMK